MREQYINATSHVEFIMNMLIVVEWNEWIIINQVPGIFFFPTGCTDKQPPKQQNKTK